MASQPELQHQEQSCCGGAHQPRWCPALAPSWTRAHTVSRGCGHAKPR